MDVARELAEDRREDARRRPPGWPPEAFCSYDYEPRPSRVVLRGAKGARCTCAAAEADANADGAV